MNAPLPFRSIAPVPDLARLITTPREDVKLETISATGIAALLMVALAKNYPGLVRK